MHLWPPVASCSVTKVFKTFYSEIGDRWLSPLCDQGRQPRGPGNRPWCHWCHWFQAVTWAAEELRVQTAALGPCCAQQHKWSLSPAALSPVTDVKAVSTENIKSLGNCWGGNAGDAGQKGGDVVQHSPCCQTQLLTCPSSVHQ